MVFLVYDAAGGIDLLRRDSRRWEPNAPPRRRAAPRPRFVRSTITDLSNSAMPTNMINDHFAVRKKDRSAL